MSLDTTTAPARRSGEQAAVRGRLLLASLLQPSALLPALIGVVLIIAAATTTGFWSTTNIRSVLFGAALVGILACGLTLITVSGNVLSMSLGITTAACAIAFVYFLRLGTPAAIAISLGLGTAICGVQGLVVGVYGANPIILTIGAGVAQTGVVEWLTGGESITPPAHVSYSFMAGTVAGIPFAAYVFVAVAVVLELLLRRTALGREMCLTGANKLAARAAALPVARITIVAFAVAGLCAGATGVLLGATNESAGLALQANYTFDAITAVLIVGTVITGGRGSAIRSAVGAIGIAVIASVVQLREYSFGVQVAVEGLFVLAIVMAAQIRRRSVANR